MLLGDPVLRDGQGAFGRVDGGVGCEPLGGVGRDVLELVGDDLCAADQACERFIVVVGRNDEFADFGGGAVGVGIKKAEAEAEGEPGEGEHAAELAAAEDADDHVLPPRRARPRAGAKRGA